MRSRDLLLMLALSITAGSAYAESCHINSIDEAGRCKGRGFARAVVERELQGRDAVPPSPPVDANLLATQLLGTLGVGQMFPVSGAAGQWVLLAADGEVQQAAPNGYEIRLQHSSFDGDDTRLIALLHWQPAEGENVGLMRVLATTSNITALTSSSVEGGLPCVVPDGQTGGEGFDAVAAVADDEGMPMFPRMGGEFGWVALTPQHRVLAAAVSRSEGYAGGGGSFNGQVLLDQQGHTLVPVACHATTTYVMTAGEWNPDGTRQHDEYQAAWRLRPQAEQGPWPRLQLQPETRGESEAWLKWDADKGHYVKDDAVASPVAGKAKR